MSRRRHPNERNPFPPFDSGVTRLGYGHRPSLTPSPLGGQTHGDSSSLERFSAHLFQQATTASLIAPFLPRLLNVTPPPNAGDLGRNQFPPQSQPPPPQNLHDPMSHHRPDHPSGRHDPGFHWQDPDGYQYETNPCHRTGYNQFSEGPHWSRPDEFGGHRTDGYPLHTMPLLERPPLSRYSEPQNFETRPSLLGRGGRLFNDNRHFDDREPDRNPPLLISPREHATRVSDSGYRSYEMMPPDELRLRDYPAPYNAPIQTGSRDHHVGSMPQDMPMRSLPRGPPVGSMPHDPSNEFMTHDLPKYSRPGDPPMAHASVDYWSHDLPKYSRPGDPPVGSMPRTTVDYRPHDSPYESKSHDSRSRERWSHGGPRSPQPNSSTSPFRDEDYSRTSSPLSLQSNPSRGSSRGSTFRGSLRDLSTSSKPDWSGRLRQRHSSDHGSTTSGRSSGSGTSRESSLDRGSRRRDRERGSGNERDQGRQRHSSCDEGKSMPSSRRDRSKKDYGPALHSPITTSPLVSLSLKDPSLGRLEKRLGPKVDETTSLRSHSPSTNLDLSRNSLEDRLGPKPSTCIKSRLGPSPEKPSIHARLGPKISGGGSLKSDRSVSPAGERNLDLRVKLDERKRSSASKSASSSPVTQASPKLQLASSSSRGQSQATSSGDKPRSVTPEHPKAFSVDGKKNVVSTTSSTATKAPITHTTSKRKSPELAKSVTHPPPSRYTQKQQASTTPPSANVPSHHAPIKRNLPEMAKSSPHPVPSRLSQVPTTSSETKRRPQSSSKEKEIPKTAAGKSQQVITTPSIPLTRPEVVQVPEGGPKDMDLDSDSDSEGRLVIDIGGSTACGYEKESPHFKKGVPRSNQEKEKEGEERDTRLSSSVVVTTTTSTAATKRPLGDKATQQSFVHSAQLNLRATPQSVKLPRADSDVASIVTKSTSRSVSSSPQRLVHAPRPLITTPKVTPQLVERHGDFTKVVSQSTDGSKSAAYTTVVNKPTTTQSLVQRVSSAFSSVQVASPRFSITVPLPAQSHSSISSAQISTSSYASVTSVRATTWPVHRPAVVASSTSSGAGRMQKGPPTVASTPGTLGHPHRPAVVATSTSSGAGPPIHGTLGHPHRPAVVATSTSSGAGPPIHGTVGHPHQPAVVAAPTSSGAGPPTHGTLGHPHQPAVVATPTSSGAGRMQKGPNVAPTHGTLGHPHQPAMVASLAIVGRGRMQKGPNVAPTHGTLGHPHQPAMVASLAIVGPGRMQKGPNVAPTHGTLGHPDQPAVVASSTSSGSRRMQKGPNVASTPGTLGPPHQPAVVASSAISGAGRMPKVPLIASTPGTLVHQPAVVASSAMSGAGRMPKVPLIASTPGTLVPQPAVVATSKPKKKKLGPAEKFAQVFIGRRLVEKLAMIQISGSTILQRFRQNISKTFGCFRCWTFHTRTPVDVSFFLRRYFKGFYTATLTETWAKNNHARDLFREELEFLHKHCQEDTSKWLERTETYDWICKVEFRKAKIQEQWEKITATTSQMTVPNVTLRAKTGEVVRLEPSSYRLKCQKPASASSSKGGPYNQEARDSGGGKGRYYLSKLPPSTTKLTNVVIEDIPVPPSTSSVQVASSNRNTDDGDACIVSPEVDRDEVIVIDSSSDETGEDLVRTNEASRLIQRSPSPSRLIQRSPSPSRLIQRSPSPSRLIRRSPSPCDQELRSLLPCDQEVRSQLPYDQEVRSQLPSDQEVRSPSPSDQEVGAITSNSLPKTTTGSLQGSSRRLDATSQVKHSSLCDWGTELLTTILPPDCTGDAPVVQTRPLLSDGLDPHMLKNEAPPSKQVPSSVAVQVTESEISVLKQLEKELESGIEQVRNLELNRPLTVESYDYDHQSAIVHPIMHASTEMAPGGIPSPPEPTPLRDLASVSYDRDDDIISDSRPHAQVPDKSGSLSPGEIVSPTPSFEEIIDKISTDAARGVNQDASVLPLGGTSKNSSGSQHEPGLTRHLRSRHGSLQYRSPPRWGRERSRSRSFSPKRGHSASKRLPSPPRRTSSRYHQGLSSHSPGTRYRSGFHSERGMESSTTARSTRSRPWSSRSRSRSPSSRDQERGSRSSMSTRSRTHSRGENDGSGSTRRGYGTQHGTEDKPHRGYSPKRSLTQKFLRVFDSDDDLELLELRKDAIMSMIGEGGASQREDDSKGDAEMTESATSGRREAETLEQGKGEVGMLEAEAEAKEPGTTVAEQGTAVAEQGMTMVGTSARREETMLEPEAMEPEITEVEPGKITDQVTVEKQKAESTGQEVVPSVEEGREAAEVVKATAQQPLLSLIPTDPERPKGSFIVESKPSKVAAVKENRKAKSVSPTPVCVPRVSPRLTKLLPPVSGVIAAKPLASKPISRQPTPISQPSSRAGSRFSSPVSSVQSPPMFLSAGGSKVLPSRKASMSVKVVSSDTMTWEVPECRIQLSSGEEEETSSSESDSEPVPQRAVTGLEIDAVLSRFRRAAEAKAKLPSTQGQGHIPSSLPERPTSETSEPTSPLETLNLPRPPDSLPPDKKQEYMALQRKLALHKKRVSRQEVKRKGKGKEKSSSQPKSLVKSKPRVKSHTVQERPTKRLKIKRPALKKASHGSTATTTVTTTEEEGRAKTVRLETLRRMEEERRVREEKEKRVAGYEQAIRDSRSNLEKEQHQLTSLTHQLIDCESEVEECELKMELLKKQLKLTEESYAKAKAKSSGLQDKVRLTKEQISKHTSAIQKAERSLAEANTSGRPPPTSVEENIPPLPRILIQEPLSASVDDKTVSTQEGIMTATGPLTTGAEFPLFPCVRIQELSLLSASIAESKKPMHLRTASSRDKTAVLLKADTESCLLSDYERVSDTESTPVRVARSAVIGDSANSGRDGHLLKPSTHGLIVEPISDAEDGLSPISVEMVSDSESLDLESQNKIVAAETEIGSQRGQKIVSGTEKCNLSVVAEVVSGSETLELEYRNETHRTPLTESSGTECERESIPKNVDTTSRSPAPSASPVHVEAEPKDPITTSRPPAPFASFIRVEGTPKTTSLSPAPSASPIHVEPISDSDEEDIDVVGTPDSQQIAPEMNEILSSHENMASNEGVELGSIFSLKITSVCSLCPDPSLSKFEVPQAIDQASDASVTGVSHAINQASIPQASDTAMTNVPQAIDRASDASVTGVSHAINQASIPQASDTTMTNVPQAIDRASDASVTGVSHAIDQTSTPRTPAASMTKVPHAIDQTSTPRAPAASNSEMAVTIDREPDPSIPSDMTLQSSAHLARIKVEHNYSLPSELIHILCAPPSSSKRRKIKGNGEVKGHGEVKGNAGVSKQGPPSIGAVETGAAPKSLQIQLPEVESVRKARLDKQESFAERLVESPGMPNPESLPAKLVESPGMPNQTCPEKQDTFPEEQVGVIEGAAQTSGSHPQEEQPSDLTGEQAQQSGKVLTPASLSDAPSNNEAHKPALQPALSLEQQGERPGVEARSDASPASIGSPRSRRKSTHPRHLCLQPLSPSSSGPSRRKSCKPKRLLPSQPASSGSPVFNQTLIYSALSPKLSSLLSPSSVQKVVDYFQEHSSRPGSFSASESTSRTSTLERAVALETEDGDDRSLPSRQPSTTASFVSVFSTSQTLSTILTSALNQSLVSCSTTPQAMLPESSTGLKPSVEVSEVSSEDESTLSELTSGVSSPGVASEGESYKVSAVSKFQGSCDAASSLQSNRDLTASGRGQVSHLDATIASLAVSAHVTSPSTVTISATKSPVTISTTMSVPSATIQASSTVTPASSLSGASTGLGAAAGINLPTVFLPMTVPCPPLQPTLPLPSLATTTQVASSSTVTVSPTFNTSSQSVTSPTIQASTSVPTGKHPSILSENIQSISTPAAVEIPIPKVKPAEVQPRTSIPPPSSSGVSGPPVGTSTTPSLPTIFFPMAVPRPSPQLTPLALPLINFPLCYLPQLQSTTPSSGSSLASATTTSLPLKSSGEMSSTKGDSFLSQAATGPVAISSAQLPSLLDIIQRQRGSDLDVPYLIEAVRRHVIQRSIDFSTGVALIHWLRGSTSQNPSTLSSLNPEMAPSLTQAVSGVQRPTAGQSSTPLVSGPTLVSSVLSALVARTLGLSGDPTSLHTSRPSSTLGSSTLSLFSGPTSLHTSRPSSTIGLSSGPTSLHTSRPSSTLGSSTIGLSSGPTSLHTSRPSSTIGLSSGPTTLHTSRPSSTIGLSSGPTTLHTSRPSSTIGLSNGPTTLHTSRPSSTIVLSSDPTTLHTSRPSSTLGLSSDPTSLHTSRPSSTLGLSSDPTSPHTSRPSSTLVPSSDPATLPISRPSSLCSTSEGTPNVPTRHSPDYNHLNRSRLVKRCSSTPPRSPWLSNASRLSEVTFQIDTPNALFDVLSPNTFLHLPRVMSDLPLEIEATAVDVTVLSNIAGVVTSGTGVQGEKCEGSILTNITSAVTPGTRMQGEKSEGSILTNVTGAVTPGTRMQGEKCEGSILTNITSSVTPGTRMQGEKSEGAGDSVSCDVLEESKKTGYNAATFTTSPVNVTSLAPTIAPASLNRGRKTRAVLSDVAICRTQATPSLTTAVTGTAGHAPVNTTSVVLATVLSDVAICRTQATPSLTTAVAETAGHAPVNTTPAVIVTSHAHGVAMTTTPKPSVATAMGGTGTAAVVCSSGDPICAVTVTTCMPVKQATVAEKPVSALRQQATAPYKPVSALRQQATAPYKPVSALRQQATAPYKPVSSLGQQATVPYALGKQPTAPYKPVSALRQQATAVDKPVSALGQQTTAVDKPVSSLGQQATAPDKPVTALGQQATAPYKPVSSLGQQATAPYIPVSALGQQATAVDKPVSTLTDKPGALRKTVAALGNPVTAPERSTSIQKPVTSTKRSPKQSTTVLQALEKIQNFQDELQRQIDLQRELLAAKRAQPSSSSAVHVLSEKQTTVQSRISKAVATDQDVSSTVSVAAKKLPSSLVTSLVTTKQPPSSVVASSVATKQPPSSHVASSVTAKQPPSSVVTSSVAAKQPSSDVASSVTTKQPPSSVVTSSVATKQPPSSHVASSVTTKQLPSSDVASSVATKQPPSSVVASSVTTKQPPSSGVATSVAAKQLPSSNVASLVTTKQPPSSVVASSVATKQLPSSVVANSVATKQLPSSVVTSSVTTKQPPSSHVASSVATKQLPSSVVTSSVTTKQPPSSVVASSVATKQPPPSSDVASSVAAKQPPSSVVASSVTTKQLPSSVVASSVTTKQPPSSVVTSSVAAKQPPSSHVTSSVATKQPPSSVVASSVATKQPPSSHVASSVTAKQPPSSHVASSVTAKQPPSSVVASSVAAKQPPSSVVASSVAAKQPPSSVVASSVTTKQPSSDVASSVATKQPPSSVVASSVTTKQPSSDVTSSVATKQPPPSSEVATSVATKQPSSSAMVATLKQPLSMSADPSVSGKEISIPSGPGSRKRTKGVPTSSEESIPSGPGSRKLTKVVPASTKVGVVLPPVSRKRAGVPVTKETKRQKVEGTSPKQNAVMMDALKQLGIQTTSMRLALGRSQGKLQLNVDEVLENLKPNPPLSTLFLSTDNVGSPSLPVFTMPESTLASLEKQERASLAGEKLRSEGGYTPYSSPLLPLQSYRLSPFYRTHAKLPLSSVTYSNKIDPHKIMCKFELHGICNDPNCTAQHLRDIGLSKQELVQDLVAYAPTLAGCSGRDLEIVDGNMPDLQSKISEKVSRFSRNMIQSLGGKLTDEQLFTLATHDVNKERTKLHPRTVGNFVRLEERYWLTNPRGEREGRSVGTRERLDVGSGGAQVVATEEEGMEITASSGVLESEHKQLSSRQRYFCMGESHVTTALEERVKADPSDVGAWISLAERARGKGRTEEARELLEEGLESSQSSEELWVEWLRVKASELSTSSPPVTHDQRQQVLDDLCTRAMTACPSYAVVFECIRLAESYDAKQKWISEGYKEICKQNPLSPSSSHRCLELFLNVILLDQLSGRSNLAVTRFHEALTDRQQSSDTTHPYTGLLTHLIQDDCVLAHLCLINLEYHGSLPSSVFQPSNAHPPVRLVNKDPFVAALWNKQGLSNEAQQRIKKLLDGFCPPSFPSPLNAYFSECIPLYHHLVVLEALRGRRLTAINLLSKLMSLCPFSVELWLLHAKFEVKLCGCRAVLNKAVEQCTRKVELYYFGARMELNRGCTATSRVQSAVNWLSRCVLQFYHPTPDEGGAPDLRESLLLYRKLLGQMVPYDYKPPDFAEGVDPKQLGESLAPLWMCYCLLVELVLPSVVPEDFLPTSVEDAFESAVHSVHDSKGMRSLWLEYLGYVRAQVVKGKGSAQSFKVFSNCVQRCLLAVDTRLSHAHHVYGQPTEYHDHSFHNEVVEMFLSCLPYVSSYKLSTLRNLVRKFPKNHLLVARLVECALDQTPEQMELAQDALASYLAEDPRSPLLWRMAIFIELRLNRTREARWMYHHAVKALPFHAELWREFVLFELKQQVSPSPTQNPLLLEVVQKAQQLGIHL